MRFQRLGFDTRSDLCVGRQARVSLSGHFDQFIELVGLCLGDADEKKAGACPQTSDNCRTGETKCFHVGDRVEGRRV